MTFPQDSQIPETYNRIKDTVLKHAIANGDFTVPLIADLTGYSTTTVAKCINAMKDSGLVHTVSSLPSHKKGRKAVTYGIDQNPIIFLGVDVKDFELGIGIMNLKGDIISHRIEKDYTYENTHRNLEEVCRRVDNFISETEGLDRSKIAGANFNFSGRVDSRVGVSSTSFNFEETKSIPLADLLTDKLGFPVYIENDTKAMAFGEYLAYGKKWQNILYVNIGWGLGLGIILDGKIYYGSQGFSGELGHVPFYDNNILCHCGKKGCVETEISGAAIVRKITERIQAGEASSLSEKVKAGQKLYIDDIIQATGNEDPLCIKTVSETGIGLGRQLAGLINLFNPECIIIGGSLAKIEPYYFLQQTLLAIRQYSLKLMSQNVSVLSSRLSDLAGITGACLIAREKVIASTAPGGMQMKSIEIPFVDELESMNEEKFNSAMTRNTAGANVDIVNWPGVYSYCPRCSFRIARSSRYLAVTFDVKGKDLRATEMSDNGRCWEDSCCEFFVSTQEGFYYNIEVNCIGSIRIGHGTSRSDRQLLPDETVAKVIRRSTLEHKRYEYEGGSYRWRISILVPFEVIGLDPENLPKSISGNFYKCGDLTSHPHFVSWSPIASQKPDFHRPEFFGKLIF